MTTQGRANGFLLHDVLLILGSVFVALFLVKSGVLVHVIDSVESRGLLGSFIAGMFFTSVFTTAPAIATLGETARLNPVIPVAACAALGAVIGDLIIFKFIRDRFSEHVVLLLNHRTIWKRLRALLKLRLFRWLSLFVGGVIIASPLPDEIGISFLGFSKMKTIWFIPLSFFFNFIGILLIGLIARVV